MTTTTQPRPLTARQRLVVQAIYRLMLRDQRPPTYRELQEELDIQYISSLYCIMLVLYRKGIIAAEHMSARSLTLAGVQWEYLGSRAVPTIDYSTPEGWRLLRELSR